MRKKLPDLRSPLVFVLLFSFVNSRGTHFFKATGSATPLAIVVMSNCDSEVVGEMLLIKKLIVLIEFYYNNNINFEHLPVPNSNCVINKE